MEDKRNTKPHILVVDDERTFRNSLKAALESEGYKVIAAADGKIAKEIVTIENVDCVLSDINMPGLSGLALLKHVKGIKPKLPVILMTGFSVLDETRQADEMGANGFIAKPFQKADLMAILHRFFPPKAGPAQPPLKKVESSDEQYSKVSIDEFVSGRAIKYDIFIKLSDARYVKIATSGEDLSIDRIRSYKTKGLHYLYLKKQDYQKYLELNVVLAKTVSKSPAISQEKKVRFLKHANDVIMEQLYFSQIDQETFSSAKVVLEATLDTCANDAQCLGLLEALNGHDNFLYAHCLGVSTYGVMIAGAMEWKSQATLSKIALGGLMHDIGKKEIDPATLAKARKDFTVGDVQAYESHVMRGVEILQSIGSIPDDVLQIVLQHHEDCLGTGFPVKIQNHQIHPMAKVVAVADQFCTLAIRTAHSEPIDPVAAIRRMILLKASNLDRVALSALAKIFKIEPISMAS